MPQLEIKKESSLINYLILDVKIDDGVKIHVRCNVHHHVKIEKYATLSPGSIILGEANIGENSFIGSGSIINPRTKIGKNCIIGWICSYKTWQTTQLFSVFLLELKININFEIYRKINFF